MAEERKYERGLFMALPTYGFQRCNTIALIQSVRWCEPWKNVYHMEINSSLLARAFNVLWQEALKKREEGKITHFLMLHADIIPMEREWVTTMARLAASVGGAEVLSVVSPIKDERGLTSIALETSSPWAPRRLTMAEIMAQENDVFTHPDLLVNTGMLLVDMRRDWVKNICFTIKDAILKVNPDDATGNVGVQPEDWDFSRQAKAAGVTLWASRKPFIRHVGTFQYPNQYSWGTDKQDGGDAPRSPEAKKEREQQEKA